MNLPKNVLKMCAAAAILGFSACAGTRSGKDPGWVEKTLASMTLEEKIGQMMFPAFYPRFYHAQDSRFQRLSRLVRDYHIGGVMFYRSGAYDVARSVARLQAQAKRPLMVMADVEWGLAMRVNEGTTFPQNMAVGATGSEDYAYEMGAITGKEASALGIHVGFSPVMDVNSNPENVIINTRSYGEDPALVSRLGTAFIRGLQENGVYATAKHFPGHGDTSEDSHLQLPVVDAAEESLREVALPPFQAAVRAGVKCVMVAHIAFSEIAEMQGRPATLDPYFIETVLRGQMGFDGLVISDGMDMGGITQNYWSGEAAVLAIKAGVDVLLIPPEVETTFQYLLASVRVGRLAEARLDESVRRILRAKLDFGLDRPSEIDLHNVEETMADSAHLARAAEIADASITLLRDRQKVLPLHAEKIDSLLVITVSDSDDGPSRGSVLNPEVQKHVPGTRTAFIDVRSTTAEVEQIVEKAASMDALLIGVFVNWRDHKGTIALPDTTVALVRQLFALDRPMAVVTFGSPYVFRQIPEVPSYLCTYGTGTLAIRAACRAVFGEIPVTAKIPVSVPGHFAIGDGLRRPAYSMELAGPAAEDRFSDAYQVLKKAIADSVFPGAQVAIVQDGKLLASSGFGHQTYDPASPAITTETLYDMASVTKVAATTVTAMHLWEKGKLRLDIPVRSYLPDFSGGLKDSVTLRHLFTHSGGLHWWADLWNKAGSREEALDYIYELPLDYAPGDSMIYSDLGLIMIGEVLRTVTGKNIAQLAREIIYQPMGMQHTMFNPARSLLPAIAPTEVGGGLDRGLIHGEVHDENTHFLGGVSTHAGLFSTASDMAALAQMLLNGGVYKHRRFFSPATVRYWTARQNLPAGSSRALGWDTPSAVGSLAGDYFSAGSFGHTGFTGTSLWIDPNRKIAIVLLTNRVHPTRERGGIRQVRRDFHNSVMQKLLSDATSQPE